MGRSAMVKPHMVDYLIEGAIWQCDILGIDRRPAIWIKLMSLQSAIQILDGHIGETRI